MTDKPDHDEAQEFAETVAGYAKDGTYGGNNRMPNLAFCYLEAMKQLKTTNAILQLRDDQMDKLEADLERSRAMPGELAKPMMVLRRLFGRDVAGGDTIKLEKEEHSGRIDFVLESSTGEVKRVGVTAADLSAVGFNTLYGEE